MSAPLLRIGDWTVDGSSNELWSENVERRPLRHKAMATLLLLAETPGQVVTRETLIERVWDGNAFVAQKAINTAIWTIRQALGDDPEAPRYVETIAKKGYRLIAPAQQLARAPAAPAALPRPRRAWGLAGLLALALLCGAIAWTWRASEPARPLQGRWLTQQAGVEFIGQRSPDAQWLAYAWWQGKGDAALMLRRIADPAGSARVLASAQGDVQSLAWLEGGRALAFAVLHEGRCRLWRVELEGGAPPRPLAECSPLFTPVLAADDAGRRLVITAPGEGRPGLFLLQADGSAPRRLSISPDALLPDHQPAFSPDGRRLAFVRSDPLRGTRDLYELRLDGEAEPKRLTQRGFSSLHGLAYAADGQDLILSTTQHDARVLQRWQRRDGHLLPLGQEGSAPMRQQDGALTVAVLRGGIGLAQWQGDGLQDLAPALVSRRGPALSADAEALAFVSRGQPGDAQLWIAAPLQDEPRQVLQLPGDIGRPAWSPDGQSLAFWARCGSGGQQALCLWQRRDGALRVLLQDGLPGGAPVWLDDQTLAFSRPQGERWQAWTLALDGVARPMAESPTLRPLARLVLSEGRLWSPGTEGPLHWQPGRATVQTWALPPLPAGERVISWTPHPDGGLWLLSRGAQERLLHQRESGAAAAELARWSLGALPEFPNLSAAGGRLVLERSGGAQGDLLELR